MPINQEDQAIHLRMGNSAPWDGMLIKEKLARYYRDQTDQNAYLREQLLTIQVPQCDTNSSWEVILGVITFGLGIGFGAIMSHR